LRDYNQPDWTQEQLQCTPKGQVMLMPGERSVFQINADTAASLKTTRGKAWGELYEDAKRQLIRDTIGAQSADTLPEAKVEVTGRIERDSGTIQKLVLNAETGLQLPALLFEPRKPNGKAVLYLHGTSMKEDAAPGGAIDALVKQGYLVLAAELRGIGETETGLRKRGFGAGRFGRDNLETLTAYLMGKSYVGMRTDDVRRWTRFLKAKVAEVQLVAAGEAVIPALHAAALDREAFHSITLRQMIPSWQSLMMADETFDQLVNTVHGVLRHYDLPDLIEMVGRDRVTVVDPVDGMGRPVK
jgi:hypothetical protein